MTTMQTQASTLQLYHPNCRTELNGSAYRVALVVMSFTVLLMAWGATEAHAAQPGYGQGLKTAQISTTKN